MQPTAFLVNTAGLALVDADALVEALVERRIAAFLAGAPVRVLG